MTLIAAIRIDGNPVLIVDYLVTAGGSEQNHIEIPTYSEIERIIPNEYNFPIVNLVTKTLKISDNVIIAGAGNLSRIRDIFQFASEKFIDQTDLRQSLKNFF